MNELILGTADLCDQYQEILQVLHPKFKSLGGVKRLSGEIKTLKIQQDNQGFWDCVRSEGRDRILVVDAQGDLAAVMGDQMAKLAVENGWKGVVINGYIRDVSVIRDLPLGVWALGVYPMKGSLKVPSQHHVPLSFGGIQIDESYCLYADEDGVVFSSEELIDINF